MGHERRMEGRRMIVSIQCGAKGGKGRSWGWFNFVLSLSALLFPSHLYLFALLQSLHNGIVCRASKHALQLDHLLPVSGVMPCEVG